MGCFIARWSLMGLVAPSLAVLKVQLQAASKRTSGLSGQHLA